MGRHSGRLDLAEFMLKLLNAVLQRGPLVMRSFQGDSQAILLGDQLVDLLAQLIQLLPVGHLLGLGVLLGFL
jgi:hypothetical protein